MYPNAEPYRLLLQMILNVFNVMSIIYVYKCMQLYIDIHRYTYTIYTDR